MVYPSCTSMFPKCTHESFSQKLYEKFRNNKRFCKPKLSRTAFTIQHYAGEVSNFHNITFLSVHLLEYIPFNFILFYFPGNLPIWSVPGQKQRLCSCRTSRITECFQVLFCVRVIPISTRGEHKSIEVLHCYSLQGIILLPDYYACNSLPGRLEKKNPYQSPIFFNLKFGFGSLLRTKFLRDPSGPNSRF